MKPNWKVLLCWFVLGHQWEVVNRFSTSTGVCEFSKCQRCGGTKLVEY